MQKQAIFLRWLIAAIVLLASLGILGWTLYQGATPPATPSVNPSPTSPTPDTEITHYYSNRDYQFSLMYPDNWYMVFEGIGESEAHVAFSDENITNSVNISASGALINVFVQGDNGLNATQWADERKSEAMSGRKSYTIDGVQGVWQYDYREPELEGMPPLYEITVYLVKQGKLYQLDLVTHKEDIRAKNEKVFTDLLSTFKFTS